jgi:hypothetical protein
MALPIGIERLVFAGATRQFPAPISGRELDIGFLDTYVIKKGEFAKAIRPGESDVPDADLAYVEVTHALVDRTFAYRILSEDAKALFVPENKFRPHVDDGDWYYGENRIWKFISDNSADRDKCRGIVYARRDAPIWWRIEGVSAADLALPALRPMFGPGELVPVEFRGLYDQTPPRCCDE